MFTDPVLNKLVKKYPAPQFEDRSEILFQSITKSIISQQLSVKAAATIFIRFKTLFAPKEFPEPKDIIELKEETIRTAGISSAKVSYIKSLAYSFAANEINIRELKKMSDEEVIKELTKLKGVGKWTAEMILIFSLKRPDVFSLGDLGLRKAIGNLYGITEEREIMELADSWKPHRSTACWYLWRSLENM